MKANIILAKGTKKEAKIDLPKEIFGQEVNENLLRQAVRVYLFNQRQGNVKVKTRSEVSGSRIKIWRQKGTGRARHGDRYSNIFVGGGVTHGPTQRDWSRLMPKKMKRKALICALSAQFAAKQIFVVEGLDKLNSKTKEYAGVMTKKLGVELGKDKALFITGKGEKNLQLGMRNLSNVELKTPNLINTYEVLYYDKLFFTPDGLTELKDLISK
ncbi:50S ribosomal protein L4 [Candidatus Roizmanbacteria bacterium CG22_combo_CG10-13_8_21_14_all_38_20]|uniref:Large ribosomal subunit protein uL4 n=1 Tax=Candidatus Roizmanbacteria bacterium CG22_combo_CG10-13_8_21_14_all_38_20 TaxID=1974862 RepID=A0A2H0BWU0_9BACT|nr:50S ribosomal protein L4 [Candidatus Microgenomates bacterium]PIP62155.1 MAG: 50S ribosomal protein L4 [Candidatus Roizmanbacteria bacterium CG22_combo_CG10-13_8_21_14_all_38_20]PJC30907.1 MAG: 50S ribosomal protein L4 [Candidatus Roizmanbacteria bacterium CG_4_9_14_0_2_um_filter_38_17]